MKIWIIVIWSIDIAILILGIILSICFKDPIYAIVLGCVTLSAILLFSKLKIELNGVIKDLSNEREKVTNLYTNLAQFSTEDELAQRELAFGLGNKNIPNKVVIISNNLSREILGKWGDTVIKSIKNNVNYTYFTTKDNLQYFNGIIRELKNNKKPELINRLTIYSNDTYFEFMPAYSEIVIYDNVGNNVHSETSNIRECYICYTNQVIGEQGENLLYERVPHDFCKSIINKIDNFKKSAEEITSDNCKLCNFNSKWEKYELKK